MTCPLHAWGDESIRSHGLDAPTYLLGASLIDVDDADRIRDQMRRLRTGTRKLHWHDMDERHRRLVVDQVRQREAGHLIVIASPIDLRKQERARALCVERLAWELAQRDVTALTLEARPTALMARDRRTFDALRQRAVISHGMRIGHGQPSGEPLLWLPDQVLGVVGDALRWGDVRTTAFGTSVEIVEIDP